MQAPILSSQCNLGEEIKMGLNSPASLAPHSTIEELEGMLR
jgi:hypothetical protein